MKANVSIQRVSRQGAKHAKDRNREHELDLFNTTFLLQVISSSLLLSLVFPLCLCGRSSQISTHGFQARLNRFNRSGERKADMAFAMWTKDDAWHSSDLGAVEQQLSGGTTVNSD